MAGSECRDAALHSAIAAFLLAASKALGTLFTFTIERHANLQKDTAVPSWGEPPHSVKPSLETV